MFTMFLIWTLANLTAGAIWTAAVFALVRSKKFITWSINYYIKLVDRYTKDLEELFDADYD